MNHDATHCADYEQGCPRKCYRAQLTADLRKTYYPLPTSWAHFEGTSECPKCKKESEVAERREDIENSPADCSTSSVTDQKGEGK